MAYLDLGLVVSLYGAKDSWRELASSQITLGSGRRTDCESPEPLVWLRRKDSASIGHGVSSVIPFVLSPNHGILL